METNDKKDRRDDIFSRSVRAGKRTYFFDVKATRADDYYLTITESTKRFNDDGTFYYEKHRLFLYNEDFEKYAECLAEVTKYIIDEKGAAPIRGKGGYTGNDAASASQSNNGTPPATDETNTGTEKTEEEVDLVEDAHEKAITEIGSEKNGVDNTDAETSDVQTEETPANVESETETKTE
ncbi:MAG TPA: DUF3276 family protein [Flavobacteriales bacterium]|nr:DUF3276 family protein [Flavobacteriales bacterium]